MIDLTAIKTPFGLLDSKTQEALKAHGGPYKFAAPENDWKWLPIEGVPLWSRENVYCVDAEAAPPKPREKWITGDNCAWNTLDDAMAANHGVPVLYREVLP